MRTSLNIDDETYAIVEEMAEVQGRTIASTLRHLIRTNNEVVGMKAWKRSGHLNGKAGEPVRVDK